MGHHSVHLADQYDTVPLCGKIEVTSLSERLEDVVLLRLENVGPRIPHFAQDGHLVVLEGDIDNRILHIETDLVGEEVREFGTGHALDLDASKGREIDAALVVDKIAEGCVLRT